MQIIKRNSPNAGYETEDIIAIVPDDHVFGLSELNTDNFTIVTGVTLTEADEAKLIMTDERPDNYAATIKLSAFKSRTTKQENFKLIHRRKYHYINNKVTLKSNAQQVD